MDYITPLDLQTKFGADWTTVDNFDLYAEQVNAWLYGNNIPIGVIDPTKAAAIRSAAFFLARAAKEDALYENTDNIKARKGSAQPGTSFEVQYFAYARVQNRWVKIATDLLSEWFETTIVHPLYKIN